MEKRRKREIEGNEGEKRRLPKKYDDMTMQGKRTVPGNRRRRKGKKREREEDWGRE